MEYPRHFLCRVFSRASRGGVPVGVYLCPEWWGEEPLAVESKARDEYSVFLPAQAGPPRLEAHILGPGGRSCDPGIGILAAYRTLAFLGRVPERQLEVAVAGQRWLVHEELYRSAGAAQVWLELPLPVGYPQPAVPSGEGTSGFSWEGSLQPGALKGAWTWGDTMLLEVSGPEALAASSLLSLATGWRDLGGERLLAFALGSQRSLVDARLRGFSWQDGWREGEASTEGMGRLAAFLRWRGWGHPFLGLEQGPEYGCRAAVWMEGEDGDLTRLAVGGQVSVESKDSFSGVVSS